MCICRLSKQFMQLFTHKQMRARGIEDTDLLYNCVQDGADVCEGV